MIKLQILLLLVLVFCSSYLSALAQGIPNTILVGETLYAVNDKHQVWFYRGKHLCSPRNVNEKPIFNAVKLNSPALLERFLKKGGNPNIADDCGIPVLFYTAATVKFDLLKMLVKAGADVNALDGFYGKPPLLWLIDTYIGLSDEAENEPDKIYESIKFLIENGANVNFNAKSDPALIEAVRLRKTRLVKLLIASGADVNYQSGDSFTAYTYAAQIGDKELKRILIKAGANVRIGVTEYQKEWGENAFFQAAADGRTDVVEAMLASGTDANLANEGGNMTALMRAKEDSTVDALLAAGADVNLRDNSGHTALMWAVLFRLSGIVEKLIVAGADVNLRNDKGETVFDLISDDRTKEILIKAKVK